MARIQEPLACDRFQTTKKILVTGHSPNHTNNHSPPTIFLTRNEAKLALIHQHHHRIPLSPFLPDGRRARAVKMPSLWSGPINASVGVSCVHGPLTQKHTVCQRGVKVEKQARVPISVSVKYPKTNTDFISPTNTVHTVPFQIMFRELRTANNPKN